MIDFLITEDIADGHPGWTTVVAAGRQDCWERRLRTAIRRNPAIAVDQLRRMGEIE